MTDSTAPIHGQRSQAGGQPAQRVLVVEDDADFATLINHMMEATDFECDSVVTLEDGLKALAERSYGAALIDLGLPDAQGAEIWRTVRSRFPDIPVIVVTGRDDEEIAETALHEGAQDYIRKMELTPDLLDKVIRFAISRQDMISEVARARDKASALAARQGVLARIARLVSSTEDLSSVYAEIASQLRLLLHFDRLALHLIDWESGTFTVDLIAGEEHPWDRGAHRQKLPGSRTEAMALSDEVSVDGVDEANSRPNKRPTVGWMRDHGYVVMAGAPLIAHSQRLGILAAGSKVPGLETEASRSALRDVADHIAGAIGLTQAHRKTREIAGRKAVMGRIARLLSEVDNLPEAFGRISLEIADLLPFDRIAMTLLNPAGDMFEVALVHGESHMSTPPGTMLPLEGSLTEAALRSASGVIENGEQVSKRVNGNLPVLPLLVNEGFRSFIAAPMISGRHAVGALHLNSKQESRYAESDLATLREITDHIAGAVAQHVAGREAREVARTQSELAALGRTLTQSLDLDSVLDAIVPHLKSLLPSDALALGLVNEDGETFRVRHLYGKSVNPEAAPRRKLSGSATEHAMRVKRAVSLDEELAKPDETRTLNLTELARDGVKSGLVAPLVVGDEAIGALMWLDHAAGRFSGPGADIATTIASQLAGAIANSELYRRTAQLADVTEQRRALEDENAQLEAANEMKEQIIANVSHELRTPLTSMLAFADVLHRNRGGNLTAEQLTQANVIRRGGRQLELIINDLLTMSRMSAGSFSLVITEFEISGMLKDVERMMQPIVAGRSQKIETICHVDGETMFADSGRLTQALCNLVSNASRYSPPNTKITVEADRDGDAIALSVTDQGAGIPEDQSEIIFSRLPRPQSDTARAEMGAGLGLRIVKALVEAHHGAARITRAESGGARLIVRIPSLIGDASTRQAV